MRRTSLVLAAAVAAALLVSALAGCSGSQAQTTSGGGRSFNKTDVDFALQMQAHHQQALEMADVAADKATTRDVRRLARRINETQGREIDLMAGWIQQWAKQGAKLPGHGPGGHAQHGPGMMSGAQMARLDRVDGPRFDRLWLRLMIEHHRGALVMARDELSHGSNPQARELAREVLRTQKAEIAAMQRMLRS